MHAGLGAEHPKRILALHGEGRTVDADLLGRRAVVDRDLPAVARTVLHIHLEQHEGPVLGLQATLAGLDGYDGVAVVELAGKPTRQLQMIDGAAENLGRGRCLGHQVGRLGVVTHLAGKFERGARVGKLCAGILDGLHIIARRRELCHDCARMLGIVPEARLGALALELRRTLAFLVQMQVDLNLIEARRQGIERLGRDAFLGH